MSSTFTWATPAEEPLAIFNVDPETQEVSFNFGGPPAAMRWRILWARERLFAALGPVSPYTVYQAVNDGLFTRKFVLPKGTIFATNVPRKDSMRIVAAGDISFLSEFGVCRLSAGSATVAAAGVATVGYVHEDSVVVYVFRTDEIEMARIEADVSVEDSAALELQISCQ